MATEPLTKPKFHRGTPAAPQAHASLTTRLPPVGVQGANESSQSVGGKIDSAIWVLATRAFLTNGFRAAADVLDPSEDLAALKESQLQRRTRGHIVLPPNFAATSNIVLDFLSQNPQLVQLLHDSVPAIAKAFGDEFTVSLTWLDGEVAALINSALNLDDSRAAADVLFSSWGINNAIPGLEFLSAK